MIPFASFALLISITIVTFLFNSFQGFKSFHQSSKSLNLWDTAGLASATRVAKETNSMLLSLRDSLIASIESYNPNTGKTDENLITERLNILTNYFNNINLNNPKNILKNTIEYGLSPYNNQGYQKNYQNYQINLSHSDYLPMKFNPNDKSYASSLITNSQNSNTISIDELANQIIAGNNIKISQSLLNQLLESDQAILIQNHPELFGLIITNDGLSFDNLPNTIELDITTSKAGVQPQRVPVTM